MGKRSSSSILARAALLVASLLIGSLPHPLLAQTLRGRLLEKGTDRPITLALVVLVDAAGDSLVRAITDDLGRFTLTSPRPGDFMVVASALGYEEGRAGVFELGEGGELSVEFRLDLDPFALPGLDVVRRAPMREPPLVRNGFFDRMTQGGGTFFTPIDLERTPHTRITDLLAGVPYLTVVNAYPSDRLLMQDAGSMCAPVVVVDGLMASVIEGQRRRPGGANEISGSEGNLEALVSLKDVEAIEVYRGSQGLPPQFAPMSQGNCGAIVIWTRRR